MRKIRVLIVDDSALMRQLISDLLSTDPEIDVVGSASDPYLAWDKLKLCQPDVITLDVEMPRMDGLTFLERLIRHKPIPVVMVSSLTEANCQTTFRALELGAIDFVTKPKIDIISGTYQIAAEIVAKVKSAATAKLRQPTQSALRRVETGPGFMATHRIIAIGASTGGCEALSTVFRMLPADSPGIVCVIHMPEGFTKSFAARLDKICAVRVLEARDGDRVVPGHIYIAPGNYHMKIARSGAQAVVRVVSSDPVNRHRPSVDVLFRSCAEEFGANAVGVILTGMGNDGAKGLLEMRRTGSPTIAQDEATCVVFGMPKEAIELGAASQVLGLEHIAAAMLKATSDSTVTSQSHNTSRIRQYQ